MLLYTLLFRFLVDISLNTHGSGTAGSHDNCDKLSYDNCDMITDKLSYDYCDKLSGKC